jgi:hypothetical protein
MKFLKISKSDSSIIIREESERENIKIRNKVRIELRVYSLKYPFEIKTS